MSHVQTDNLFTRSDSSRYRDVSDNHSMRGLFFSLGMVKRSGRSWLGLACLGLLLTLLLPASDFNVQAQTTAATSAGNDGAIIIGGDPGAEPASESGYGSAVRRRLIRQFDFEEYHSRPEHPDGNFENMPVNWFATGRPTDTADENFDKWPVHQELINREGYPSFGKVGFNVSQRVKDKNHGLELGLNGGSCGAFLEIGAIAAVPNSDYLITARVKTDKLKHARARLVVFLVDDDGKRIEESTTSTEFIRTRGQWHDISIKVLGDFHEAAWLGMEVQLLQPRQQLKFPPEEGKILYEDVDGSALFDNIAVWQVPRIMLRTQSDVNIVRAPDDVELSVMIRDLTGESMSAQMVVYDHQYNEIDRYDQGVGDGQAKAWDWKPKLPRFGWYVVSLELYEGPAREKILARKLAAFLWLPPAQSIPAGDEDRFVIDAEGMEHSRLPLLLQMLERARMSAVVISAWDYATTAATIDAEHSKLNQVLREFEHAGISLTLSLNPMPREMSSRLQADKQSTLWAFSQAREKWIGCVQPVVLHHGQSVMRWQIGQTQKPNTFFMHDLAGTLQTLRKTMYSLAPRPNLLIPWSMQYERHEAVPEEFGLAMEVPVSIVPSNMAAHLAAFNEKDHMQQGGIHLRLRTLDAREVSHQRRIDDLLRRMIYAWQGSVSSMSLTQPWIEPSSRKPMLMPDPLLGVFTQAAHQLGGRRIVGELHLGEGLKCFILDGQAGGMMVAWNDSAEPEDAQINMYLGEEPVVIDVWGNRRKLTTVEGKQQLKLTSTPVFIEGIDARLALLRASFNLTEPFIQSRQETHVRTISITNPWPMTIVGNFLITGPDDWIIKPRQQQFSIAAGQTSEFKIRVQFPPSEVAGQKKLQAKFDFTANERYRVDMSTPMEVGLKDIRMDSSLSLQPNDEGGTDAVVLQLITNNSDEKITLYTFAQMQGVRRQTSIVPGLNPGDSVVRRYRFPNALEQLKDSSIRVGLTQRTGSPAVLNQELTIDSR